MKIAIAGKGGVGKTTIAGILARSLARKGYRVIAVDADPNPNLAITLGLPYEQASKILPIAENEELMIEKTGAPLFSHGVHPEAEVEKISVDDIVERFSQRVPDNVELIVMGRVDHPGAGCLCSAHRLLRDLTEYLIIERKEVLVMDMEAGVEHLSRGTARFVDLMLIVTEPYVKSLLAAASIHSLANGLGIPKVYVVGNKARSVEDSEHVKDFCVKNNFQLLTIIPYDEIIINAEIDGKSPLDFAIDSTAINNIEKLSTTLISILG